MPSLLAEAIGWHLKYKYHGKDKNDNMVAIILAPVDYVCNM